MYVTIIIELLVTMILVMLCLCFMTLLFLKVWGSFDEGVDVYNEWVLL